MGPITSANGIINLNGDLDMTSRPAATPIVQIDNEHVRVTKWCFPPGGETGWHKHEMPYVVVPVNNGPLLLETSDGEQTSQLKIGESYYRAAGVEHNVINPSDDDFAFVEIEIRE